MRNITNPMPFQGGNRKQKYFEGWYYKQVSEDMKTAVSFIPGISLSQQDPHCFVQYIISQEDEADRKMIKTGYCRYPADEFQFQDEPFQLRVGNSIFTATEVHAELVDADTSVRASFRFSPFTPIKRSLLMPNIMGYFAYLPKMECSHGVISMMHLVQGNLWIEGREIDFGKGKGYLEKDWGTSFPERYIWLQCCNFKKENVSIVFSAADIPLYGRTFMGFICNLTIGQQEYRFATYNGSRLKLEQVTDREAVLTLTHRNTALKLEAYANDPRELVSPIKGQMRGRIKEDPSGILKVCLTDQGGRMIYEDTGHMAGIELHGMSL